MPPLLINTLSALLTLTALALLAASLRGTPLLRKPPRRCPRCWYDLTALPATRTCPECGHTAPSERRLHKRRRHRKLAALALILFLSAYATLAIPRVRDRGWIGAVPTSALILSLPFLNDPNWDNWNITTVVIAELGSERRLRPWERWLAIRLCTRSSSSRAPGTNRWGSCEGALLWLLDMARPLSDNSSRRIWTALAPNILTPRSRWPADTALRLLPSLDATSWLRTDIDHRLVATFSHAPDDPIAIPLPSGSNPGLPPHDHLDPWTDDTLTAPPASPGTPITVTYRLYQMDAVLWQTTVALPVTILPSADPLLHPIQADLLDSTHPMLAQIDIDKRAVWLRISSYPIATAALQGATLATHIEVCKDDHPIASGQFWTVPSERHTPRHIDGYWLRIPMNRDLTPLLVASDDDPTWTIRLRSDPETALRNFIATHYWVGELTLTRDEFNVRR